MTISLTKITLQLFKLICQLVFPELGRTVGLFWTNLLFNLLDNNFTLLLNLNVVNGARLRTGFPCLFKFRLDIVQLFNLLTTQLFLVAGSLGVLVSVVLVFLFVVLIFILVVVIIIRLLVIIELVPIAIVRINFVIIAAIPVLLSSENVLVEV